MKNALEDYLKESIDKNISVTPWNEREKLPIFLSELYTFYKINLLGEQCIVAEVLNEIQGIDNLKKHIKIISNSVDCHVVFLFRAVSAFRRKTLIQERIPFIVENGQVYLPFICLDLKKISHEKTNIIEMFSPTTQLVFLYFLYNKNLCINTSELAKLLNSSAMTANRALNELYLLGLLTFEISGKTGRSKLYKRIGDKDYYSRGSKYLKNPVNKVVYVEKIHALNIMPVAGLEALSMESMLNPPRKQIRAISKKKAADIKKYVVLNKDKIADMNLIELQLWDYDPEILVKNNLVDLISMVLSLTENKDERVEKAIAERLESETWYRA